MFSSSIQDRSIGDSSPRYHGNAAAHSQQTSPPNPRPPPLSHTNGPKTVGPGTHRRALTADHAVGSREKALASTVVSSPVPMPGWPPSHESLMKVLELSEDLVPGSSRLMLPTPAWQRRPIGPRLDPAKTGEEHPRFTVIDVNVPGSVRGREAVVEFAVVGTVYCVHCYAERCAVVQRVVPNRFLKENAVLT